MWVVCWKARPAMYPPQTQGAPSLPTLRWWRLRHHTDRERQMSTMYLDVFASVYPTCQQPELFPRLGPHTQLFLSGLHASVSRVIRDVPGSLRRGQGALPHLPWPQAASQASVLHRFSVWRTLGPSPLSPDFRTLCGCFDFFLSNQPLFELLSFP